MPKSSTLAFSQSPSDLVRKTLPDVRSRWITPRECAASSADATCTAMRNARGTAIGPDVGDLVAERAALEVLEHQIRQVPRQLAEVGAGDDVGMADRPHRARFVEEAAHDLAVTRHLAMQDLDRDRTADLRVLRLVDDTHPSNGDLPRDAIPAVDDLANQVVDLRGFGCRHGSERYFGKPVPDLERSAASIPRHLDRRGAHAKLAKPWPCRQSRTCRLARRAAQVGRARDRRRNRAAVRRGVRCRRATPRHPTRA